MCIIYRPDTVRPVTDPKIWTIITTFLTGLIGAVTTVSSPWALGADGAMTLAGIVIIWLFMSGRVEKLRKPR